MLKYAVLAAASVVGLAAIALRARWSDVVGRLLGWDPDDHERNSRIAVIVVLVALAGGSLAVLLRPSSLGNDLAELAAGLAGADIADLDAVAESAPAAKRLASIVGGAAPDDVWDQAERWLGDLDAKESAVRTAASYRLWLCAWLLRTMGDARGDDLAIDLWKSGDFIVPEVKDHLRTEEQLTAALGDTDALERRFAARILGDVGHGKAAAALAGALDDPDAKVREYAVASMGRVGDTTHATAAAKLLADAERDVRSAAAEALGRIGTPAVVEALRALYLREEDWQVRAEAVRTLGRIGDTSCGPTLVAALSDAHEKVRAATVVALKRVGPSIAPLLEETARTTASAAVKAAAREVLAAVGKAHPEPAPASGPSPGATP